MQLHFRFDDFFDELRLLEKTASDLLLWDAQEVLGRAASDLKSIRGKHAAEQGFEWEIREDRPLRTIVSEGNYEPSGRKGKHRVQACISFKWKIRPLPPVKMKKKKYKNNEEETPELSENFTLCGLASTKIKFHDYSKGATDPQEKLLGSVRFEIGMPEQPDGPLEKIEPRFEFPGCFFHASVLAETDDFPFPHSLSVPRLPSFIFSPMGAVDYILGEIFQAQWADMHRHTSYDAIEFAKIQRKRFTAILDWQHKTVSENQRAAPWPLLKQSCPHPGIFTTPS